MTSRTASAIFTHGVASAGFGWSVSSYAATHFAGKSRPRVPVPRPSSKSSARIVRSIPLLDEAALQAVREWRYDPTIINGKPVPVRMTVNVNFTLAR